MERNRAIGRLEMFVQNGQAWPRYMNLEERDRAAQSVQYAPGGEVFSLYPGSERKRVTPMTVARQILDLYISMYNKDAIMGRIIRNS